MMTPGERVAICMACEAKGKYDRAKFMIPCAVDGCDIAHHAEMNSCPKRKFTETQSESLGTKVVHGAVGIVKAVTGIGGADEELIKARTEICRGCENAKLSMLGMLERCELCGCSTWAKVRNLNEKCPLDKWVKTGEFSHNGLAGDIIYSLPAIKAAGGGSLHVQTSGDGEMTRAKFDALYPLLMMQPYIFYSKWGRRPLARRLEVFRQIHSHNTDLIAAHFEAAGLAIPPQPYEPWLSVDKPQPVATVIFSRSARYPHPARWGLWQAIYLKYGEHAAFVGAEAEWETFCLTVGPVRWAQTDNLLEAARVIAGATLFCGNQSAPLAIAVGLGKPTVVEVCPPTDNCSFTRPDQTNCYTWEVNLPEIPHEDHSPILSASDSSCLSLRS